MLRIADSSVTIQASTRSVPSPPPWFGEVALLIHPLRKQATHGYTKKRVRIARRRFGQFEVIDFVAVLFVYARSLERTLEAFYERLRPFKWTYAGLT